MTDRPSGGLPGRPPGGARAQPQRGGPRGRQRARQRQVGDGRRPAVVLPLLVVCGLVALFVAWVSAEPFWLAVGHGDAGTVRVSRCMGHGELGTRCVGSFSSSKQGYAAEPVSVTGAAMTDREAGAEPPARMVSRDGRTAYVGDAGGLHLRWLLGVGLLLVIGVVVTVITDAWRLRGRSRAAAVVIGLFAPLAVGAAALALTY